MKSALGKRILFERSLRPSAATLIVVPLALLEHWYEQVVQHVGLHYFSRYDYDEEYDGVLEDHLGGNMDEDSASKDALVRVKHRGIVYLDGLGEQSR